MTRRMLHAAAECLCVTESAEAPQTKTAVSVDRTGNNAAGDRFRVSPNPGRTRNHPAWPPPGTSCNRGVLLYCHGNAGNVVDRLSRLRSQFDLTVLGFDYRGYGRSSRKPSESGLYEDARTTRRWLAQLGGIEEREIILPGRSLGGGVAVELAARDGTKTLILESTFSSVVDVGKSMMSWLAAAVSQRFDFINKIAGYTGPLIQTHGWHDTVIPFQLGIRLYETANEPKTFASSNGGHNDAPTPKYERSLKPFIASLPVPVPAYRDKHCVQYYEPESNCRPNSKLDEFLY